MTGQVVLVGASVRSLAESAVAAGLQPLCCDFFGDRDLLQLLQASGGRFLGKLRGFADMAELLRGVPQEVPLVWSGGLENAPDLLEELCRSGRSIAGCQPDAVRAVRTWQNLSRWAVGSGVRFPETRICPAEVLGGDWVLKPERSAGGAGVLRVAGGERDRDGAVEPAGAEGMLLQQRVSGLPISMVFYFDGGRVALLGASLQFCGWRSLGAGTREFLWCGNGGPIVLPGVLQQQALAVAESLATGAGLQGVCGLDFILSWTGLWLLEVNPRIPASHWIYDAGRRGLSLRLQLGEVDVQGCGGLTEGFRVQLVVWSSQPTDPVVPCPDVATLPAGIRQADVSADEAVQPGAPAFSLLLESASGSEAVALLRSAGESAVAGGEFWRNAAAELAAYLQSFTVLVQGEAEVDETAG